MLILAGVAINITLNDGIFSKTQEAAEQYNNKSQEEKDILGEYENDIDKWINGDSTVPTISATIKEDTRVNVTSGRVSLVQDGVPVPTGFTYMTGSKDTGLVIKDGANNEFVWVPVKLYEEIELEITHGTSGEKVRKWEEGKREKEYFENDGISFTGNEIQIPENKKGCSQYTIYAESQNGKSEIYVINVMGIYMIEDGERLGQAYHVETTTPLTTPPTVIYNSGFKEPVVLTKGDYSDEKEANKTTIRNMLTALGVPGVTTSNVIEKWEEYQRDDFENMIKSVQKYQGFYIGRYETATLNGTVEVKSGRGSVGTAVHAGVNQNWYVCYQKQKEFNPSSSVTSSMMWGCEWDQAMIFVKDEKNTDNSYYLNNPSEKGNFSGTRALTGSSSAYRVKNIYDLSGNLYEYVQEAWDLTNRIVRGGAYYFSAEEWFLVARRSSRAAIEVEPYLGTRLSLHIKI